MNVQRFFATKWFHTIILLSVVAIIMFGEGTVPRVDLIAGVMPVFAWVLGLLYERSILLESGEIDAETLQAIERASNTMWD